MKLLVKTRRGVYIREKSKERFYSNKMPRHAKTAIK